MQKWSQEYKMVTKLTLHDDRTYSYTVVSVLMINRRKRLYKRVLSSLNEIYQSHYPDRQPLQPRSIACDHETSAINAFVSFWPEVKILTCQFHFASILKKRISKVDINYYKESSQMDWKAFNCK